MSSRPGDTTPAAAAGQPRRRALVVAYNFPPDAAIGTMRTLRLVQRLADEGWDVCVLTSDPRTYRNVTSSDPALLARVPPSVGVTRARVLRGLDALKARLRRPTATAGPVAHDVGQPGTRRPLPGLLHRAQDVIEDALAIPDHESGWLVPALALGLWTCRRWRPDVIYSSAPPWTAQLVAAGLAAAVRRPWVADFRDPWARAPWRTRRAFVTRANARLERLVVDRADAVLFVTRANRDEFAAFYGDAAAGRFHVVPNGCDPTEFLSLRAAPSHDRFVLLHAGTLYGARNPMPVILAVARAIERGSIRREAFRLRFLGQVSLDVDLAAECGRIGIGDVVEFLPRVTRRESLQAMASASALLLVQPVTTVSVPGKAYEYLATGRPILALTEDGETADLVRASGIGVAVTPQAPADEIDAALAAVMALAATNHDRPAPSLYDGRVHAATVSELLRRFASARVRR